MDTTTQCQKMAKAIDAAHGTSIDISHRLGTVHGLLMDNSDCPNALRKATKSCLDVAGALEDLADQLRSAPPETLLPREE